MPPSTSEPSPMVLVLHPDPATARLVSLYLEPLGCKVFSTSVFEEAVDQVPSDRPVLVLVDRTRNDEPIPPSMERVRIQWPGRPVFQMMSPSLPPHGGASVNAAPMDADGTFFKPLRSEPLIQTIQKTLEEATGSSNTASRKSPESGTQSSRDILSEFETWIAEMEMGEDLVGELTESFIDRGTSYMAELSELIDMGDTRSLEKADQATHALKGMAGNLHFNLLFDINESLRLKIKVGTPLSREDFARLESSFKEVCNALQGSPWLKS